MKIKSIALFVAAYGRSALALSDSCDEGETSCNACTPLNSEFEPAGVGQVWYSECCTESETDSTVDPPVTTSKRYCHSWSLKGYPSNQHSATKPTCGETAVGNQAWTAEGQCKSSIVSISLICCILSSVHPP